MDQAGTRRGEGPTGQGRANSVSSRRPRSTRSLNRSNSRARTRLELVKLTSLLPPLFSTPSPTRETRHRPPLAASKQDHGRAG